MRILQILTASGLVTGLCAQVLVKDINPVAATTSLFSDPAGGVDVFGVIYFAADDGVHGRELWRTDGTAAGTSLVADINPGPASSNPSPPVWINGSSTFLFAADDGAHGRELWSSNGTAQATALLLDVRPGADSSSPAWLTPIVSPTFASFFFSADDGVHGRELWRSNLTAAGTTMVSDLRVGALGSMTAASEIWDDPISTNPFGYFTADNGSLGEELWRIGAGAPVLVRDINPGAASSTPRSILKSPPRGGVLFAATDATNGREPWHVVGGAASLAANLAAGSASSNPTSAVPAPVSSSTTPRYLVNGTGAAGNELHLLTIGSGFVLLKDINPGSASSTPELWAPTGFDSFALLAATTANEGRELWLTDGTSAGTVLLADISVRGSSSPGRFARLRRGTTDLYVFCADDQIDGAELWITDLTARGTRQLRDARPGSAGSLPATFVADDGGAAPTFALYNLDDGTHGFEPWFTDGTTAGTQLLKDIRGPVVSSTPRELTPLGGTGVTCLVAGEPTFGTELWRSDASAPGTILVKDIKPGNDGSGPADLTYALGKLFFRADDGTSGMELWVSDGTAAGTVLLKDIAAGNGSSVPADFTEFQGHVYFMATDGIGGLELWRTDGTPAGTTLFVELVPGIQGGNPNSLVVSNGKLFFAATTAARGTELWASDGTVAGTALVLDINPGTASAGRNGVMPLFAWDGLVYFAADSGTGDLDLWRSDGTVPGTILIGDFDGAAPDEFVGVGATVYFAATLSRLGRELWKTNGTLASTALVRDIVFGGDSDPVGLTVGGAGIVFAATTPAAGREPWTSDGTSAGTVMLKDIYPGAADGILVPASVPSGRRYTMTHLRGSARVWFAATDLVSGIELWRTDGTTASTVRVGDVNPGAGGSRPSPLVRCGASLLLSADGGPVGIELYRTPAPATWAPFGLGCLGSSGRAPQLIGNGAPQIGNSSFALLVNDARPNTSGAMLIAFAPLHLPIGGGCTLLVDLFGPALSLPLLVNARGDAALPLPIPNEITNATLRVFAQAVVADLGGSYAGIIAVSQGLEMLLMR